MVCLSIRTRFQHSAARRRLIHVGDMARQLIKFQHSAARRRLELDGKTHSTHRVSTLSRPKAAGSKPVKAAKPLIVSTLSRPKAADNNACIVDFNRGFQHSAARRRLPCTKSGRWPKSTVSTLSRPKAAASPTFAVSAKDVSTLSRPKAAVSDVPNFIGSVAVSTLSRPKAAGFPVLLVSLFCRFQHSAARRRLPSMG